MDRSAALSLVTSWTESPNLIKHMLAVEACMRALAKHFHEDEEIWGLAGLLHDADYEKYPEKHPGILLAELKKNDLDPNIIQAITAHAWHYNDFQIEPQTNFDWSLYTCDELSGLIIACALVKPDKKLASVTVESVLKKFPDKTFAKGVHRDHIELCQARLGIPLSDFINICLSGLQSISTDLGL